jgi:hypothetical protein
MNPRGSSDTAAGVQSFSPAASLPLSVRLADSGRAAPRYRCEPGAGRLAAWSPSAPSPVPPLGRPAASATALAPAVAWPEAATAAAVECAAAAAPVLALPPAAADRPGNRSSCSSARGRSRLPAPAARFERRVALPFHPPRRTSPRSLIRHGSGSDHPTATLERCMGRQGSSVQPPPGAPNPLWNRSPARHHQLAVPKPPLPQPAGRLAPTDGCT